jgi:hypothetical protein
MCLVPGTQVAGEGTRRLLLLLLLPLLLLKLLPPLPLPLPLPCGGWRHGPVAPKTGFWQRGKDRPLPGRGPATVQRKARCERNKMEAARGRA